MGTGTKRKKEKILENNLKPPDFKWVFKFFKSPSSCKNPKPSSPLQMSE
jgi:hypothetical protein